MQENTPKVFLGGTCNESTWRECLIKELYINYFNPVVPDWNDAAYQEELRQREICDYVLYVITPKMTGVYSIAEAATDAALQPKKTIFCYLKDDFDSNGKPIRFTTAQIKSLDATCKLIKSSGANVFMTLKECAVFLNSRK